MKKLWLPAILLFLWGCSQRELPNEPSNDGALSIKTQVVPQVVNPGQTYAISVELLGGAGADSVRLDVYADGSSSPLTSFGLFDDGGNVHPNDGDQVAFDGVFSQNIVWTSLGSHSKYRWTFEATDVNGRVSQPLSVEVASFLNSAPVLLKVEAPDSLPSGFEGELTFRVEVSDSNGSADINKVIAEAFKENVLNFTVELESETEGVYVSKMDKLFAIGKKGAYDLRFKAIDISGLASNVISKSVVIGNEPPQFLDFVHADSVQIPEAGNMVAFLIAARLDDDQSLLDITEVKLEWKKPDGTYSQNSPFDLYDNGLPWNNDFTGWDDGWRGDETAGDGFYSITGIFDPNQPLGDYELTFYARDFSGNTSERVTRIVTLYPREDN